MSLFLAQAIPDPTVPMKAAVETDNWVIIMFAFIVVSMVVGFAYLARLVILKDEQEKITMSAMHEQQIKDLREPYEKRLEAVAKENETRIKEAVERENRMAARIDKLEDQRAEQDRVMLQAMAQALAKVDATLETFAATMAKFTEVQSQINGDLRHLCSLLSDDGVCRAPGNESEDPTE